MRETEDNMKRSPSINALMRSTQCLDIPIKDGRFGTRTSLIVGF